MTEVLNYDDPQLARKVEQLDAADIDALPFCAIRISYPAQVVTHLRVCWRRASASMRTVVSISACRRLS